MLRSPRPMRNSGKVIAPMSPASNPVGIADFATSGTAWHLQAALPRDSCQPLPGCLVNLDPITQPLLAQSCRLFAREADLLHPCLSWRALDIADEILDFSGKV